MTAYTREGSGQSIEKTPLLRCALDLCFAYFVHTENQRDLGLRRADCLFEIRIARGYLEAGMIENSFPD